MATYKRHKHPGIRPGKQPGTYTIDYRGHDGARHQETFKGTAHDAYVYRCDVISEAEKIKRGMMTAPGEKKTLSELWLTFVEDRNAKIGAGEMSIKSLERVEHSYKALLAFDPSLEARLIEEIGSKVFRDFKAHRIKSYAKEGVNTNLRCLKTLFNFAVKKGLLDISPLMDIRPYRAANNVRFLNDAEISSLQFALSIIDVENEYQRDARDLTLFYLHTGCRLSEALYPTFTWDCDGQTALRFPKTKGGKTHTISKTDTVKAVLESRKHIPDGPFHFTRNEVYKRVKWMYRQAGIENASVHTLRKTCGAWYYMATRDIYAASAYLGHSSVKITEKHYCGLIQSLQAEYSTKFEKALNANLQSACNSGTKPAPIQTNWPHNGGFISPTANKGLLDG
ncbi:tyrosine-type recombinase/integrase [Candidatus Neomarinimicrobiota bacterium]